MPNTSRLLRAALLCAFFSVCFLSRAQAPYSGPEINVLALGAGARTVVAPVSYNTSYNWSPDALIDEHVGSGWATRNKDLTPKVFVFELAERSTINSLEFSSAQVERAPSTAAKDVKVEIGDSQGGPFAVIATPTLAGGKDHQRFPLKAPATGKFIRFTVNNNYGDAQNLELMEFSAYGKPLVKRNLPDMSGTYSSSFGKFHLQQSGAAIRGCYESHNGLIEGTIDGRVLRAHWSEGADNSPSSSAGLTVLVFNDAGKAYKGLYFRDGTEGAPRGEWNGEFLSKTIGSCPNWNPAGNQVEDQLKTKGRARLYGILFDTDSDRIKPESKPTLDALIATAKAQPTWNFEIEGYTDNVGGDAHNQTLSDKRAASVKAYLVTAGVVPGRMITHGYGAAKPVSSNETELGRSQNRRVELVKK